MTNSHVDYEPGGAWTQVSHTSSDTQTPTRQQQQRFAAFVPIAGVISAGESDVQVDQTKENSQEEFWSFESDETTDAFGSPSLIQLPPIEEISTSPETTIDSQPIAELLPPQFMIMEEENGQTLEQEEISEPRTVPVDEAPETEQEPSFSTTEPLPVLEELTEQEKLLTELLRDSSSSATGVLTDSRVNELAKQKIQQAYAMASRGAMYVAQQELIEVLRLISQEKDAQQGTSDRSTALAAGLRALREAQDFAPQGTQLEAELEVEVLCASHRTPMAKHRDAANLLPRIMLDRYLRYAQLQLAASVAGEPAGSMALHALGKLSSQLGRIEPDHYRLANRHAVAYQQAALLAHNQNYLAAHELGVLLAGSGHYAEARQLFLQVAAREPNAVVYRNLGRVQEKLGQPQLALVSRDQARQLSRQGASGTNNVQWVSPDQFTRTGEPQTPRFRTAQRSQAEPLVIPGSRQPMQKTVRR